jgi:phosphoglycolate phosphatase-like HAD superfamily hydrolase
MIDPTRVAFDIDGVIADTMSLFLDIVHEDFNISTASAMRISRVTN